MAGAALTADQESSKSGLSAVPHDLSHKLPAALVGSTAVLTAVMHLPLLAPPEPSKIPVELYIRLCLALQDRPRWPYRRQVGRRRRSR